MKIRVNGLVWAVAESEVPNNYLNLLWGVSRDYQVEESGKILALAG